MKARNYLLRATYWHSITQNEQCYQIRYVQEDPFKMWSNNQLNQKSRKGGEKAKKDILWSKKFKFDFSKPIK